MSKTESETKEKKTKTPKAEKVKPSYPHVFDFRRPCDPDESVKFHQAVMAGREPSPNTGLMTPSAFGKAFDAVIAAEEAGEVPPSLFPLYDPLRREIALARNAISIYSGQRGAKPLARFNVPESLVKTWGAKDKVNLVSGEPKPLRLCHSPDARDLVRDRAENVLTVGKHDFVVGTQEVPAVFLINASTTGNYGFNHMLGKEMSFEGKDSELRSLVGRFNNDYQTTILDDGSKPGCPLPTAPNMIVDSWGYFYRGDNKMTVKQIRDAVAAGDTTGMKFKELEEPIVGKSLSRPDVWRTIKSAMSKAGTKNEEGKTALEVFEERETALADEDALSPEEKSWQNMTVQCRISPHELVPFGFFSVQICIAPVMHFGDSLDEQFVRFVIGCHIGAAYAENRWDAAKRLKVVDEPKAKTTKKKVAKAAAKPAEPKAAKKVVKKAPAKKTPAKKTPAKKSTSKKKTSTKAVQSETEAAPVVDVESPTTSTEVEIDASPAESELTAGSAA